jgi:NitT/TauT family transport system substrate-binding protein
VVEVKSPLLTGALGQFLIRYITAKGIDRKHGVAIDDTKSFPSVAAYYQEFFQGNADMSLGTWDSYADRHLAGVPVQLVCTLTRGDVAMLVVEEGAGIQKVADLKGKTMAVPTGTGTYRMADVFFREFYKLQFNRDINIMNVPNPSVGAQYVGLKRADAGLGWEPAYSVAMHRAKNIRVLTTMQEIFKSNTGHSLYYFALAVRSEKLKAHPGLGRKIVAIFAEGAREIAVNPEEAMTVAARTIEVDKAALVAGIQSGRLSFEVRAADDPAAAADLRYQLDFMTKHGVFKGRVPDSYLYDFR